MAVNSGLPKRIYYSAYNTSTRQFVAGDKANHSIILRLDGADLAAIDPADIIDIGQGVYGIALTELQRTGVDLVLRGSSSTADILITPIQFSSDERWQSLLELDGSELRGTAKYLELAPTDEDWTDTERNQIRHRVGIDGVSAAPAATPSLSLEATSQAIKTATDKLTFNGDDVLQVDVTYWQGLALAGTVMIQEGATNPKWTVSALSLAPSGGGGGEKDWTDTEREHIRHRLGIDGTASAPAATPSLALEASVQQVLTVGGDGPWQAADVSQLALEQTLQTVVGIVNKFTFNTDEILQIDAMYWQGVALSGTDMIQDAATDPKWTASALSLAPSGGGGGEKDWTDTEREHIRNRLGIDGTASAPTATPSLALEQSVQAIKDVTDKITFNANDIIQVDVLWWQGFQLSGTSMIQEQATSPKWTVSALSLAPSGGGGGSVTYVSLPIEDLEGYMVVIRGDTLNFPIMLNVNTATVTEYKVGLKKDTADADADALFMISSSGGLEVINGEPAGTSANGSITVESTTSGVIRVKLAAEEVAKLPERNKDAILEVQLKTGSDIYTPWRQKVTITGDVVRSV